MHQLNLIGKNSAKKAVLASFDAGRLSHAIMIMGDKGIGKKVFADFVCALLTCEEKSAPCKKCSHCTKILKGIHPDVYKIYPAGKSETIGVNEIKLIKDNLYIKPNDANRKVFVIHEADRMNIHAQNAMLKMIEEPPEDSFFVFTLKNSAALLPTVRSRAVTYNLGPATIEETAAELEKRFENEDRNILLQAAELSCGNIGLAVDIVENPKTKKLYDDVFDISKALLNSDRALLTLCLGPYSSDKSAAINLAELLKLTFRDSCALMSGDEGILSGCVKAAKEISKTCSVKACLDLMSACDKLVEKIKGNANLALAVTDFEINISSAVGR